MKWSVGVMRSWSKKQPIFFQRMAYIKLLHHSTTPNINQVLIDLQIIIPK